MPNKLLNPNFSLYTQYWENGPINYPFTADGDNIYGDSPAGSTDYKTFTIWQEINVVDTVIAAKVTAWRKYESVAKNYVNGVVKSKVLLQKPDTSWVELANETKTGETGWGNILDQYDVLAHFSQAGNYKLRLETEVRSACERTNEQDKIENPYGSWSNGGFTLDDPNCYIQSYGDSQIEKYAWIEKTIEVYGTPHTATLTLDAKGSVNLYCPYQGYARFKVTLSKAYGGSWTLYDGYLSDGNWATILNNLDIKSYMSSAGTYTLTLEAWVKSGWDGDVTYYPSEAWFGNCELDVQWYSYDYYQSRGSWDDISLDITIKKYKTVVESIGTSEGTPGKKISIPKKEDIFLAESYQTLKVKLKSVSEEAYLQESFFKKIYKFVTEEIGLQEFYQHGLGFAVSEDCFLAEVYSWIKKILKTQTESVYLAEKLTAKKTAGNIITTYDITDLTDWQDIAPAVTAWIKEKTVMNT
jgi:hypothetical protein